MTGAVHFVVPRGIDDPARVSGGNVFDRRVRDELMRAGWDVRMSEIDADAPIPVPRPRGIVLVDGLAASRSPAALEETHAPVVVLAHMVASALPGADPCLVDGERRALRTARRVIATSRWTRDELVARGLAARERIVVAAPGCDDAPPAAGTATGGSLLCVGVVAPHKGQDTLIEALGMIRDEPWSCTIAGSTTADPAFVDRIRGRADELGVGDRIAMTGVLTPAELAAAYRTTDLVVAPSRAESYGMAIADALRRGIPVVASRVGGIPRTVTADAGILVAPDDPRALGDALRRWIADPALRARLDRAARRRGASLPHWSDTAGRIAATLAGVP